MIEFQAVEFGYPQRPVLKGIDLRLGERRVGIVGGNGSGKSTLVRLVNGLLRPTAGRVVVDGMDTVRDAKRVRQHVGFVFQDPDLQIIMPTVAEDLAFGLRPLRLGRQQVAARVDEALIEYGLVDHRDHPAHLLSGGQKQLLALAAVTITRPRVLVLDEPTTLLDLRNKRALMQRLSGLDQQVLMISHDLDQLHDFDRVLVIDGGRVVADAGPQAALEHYRRLAEG